MPGRDRTGPDGMGPATGRGRGPCNINSQGRNSGREQGMGYNRPNNYRSGRMFGNRRNYRMSEGNEERGFLASLENRLISLENKIEELFRNK